MFRKSNTFLMALTALLVLPFLGLSSAQTARAEGPKIGVVDIEYVIHASKKGKAAKAQLKTLFDKKQKALDADQKKLLAVKDKIENQSEMLSQDKKRALAMEYQQGLVQLQEVYMNNQKELAKKEVELMKPILKVLETVLTDLAASDSYDIIMNRSEQGVLFTTAKHDITEKVLSTLDAKK